MNRQIASLLTASSLLASCALSTDDDADAQDTATATATSELSSSPFVLGERASLYDPLAHQTLWERVGTPLGWEMASTTKVMTIYVTLWAIEQGYVSYADPIEMSELSTTRPCNCFPGGSTHTLVPGMSMSLEDALEATAASHVEPTVSLAEFVANAVNHGYHDTGNSVDESKALEQEFIALMNQHAAALGLANTHYESVSGMATGSQYTTPADLNTLFEAATEIYPRFLEFMGYRNATVTTWGAGTPIQTWSWPFWYGYYPGVDGDKNGKALPYVRSSMVSRATRLGRSLVASSIQADVSSGQDASGDVAELFRYGFSKIFTPVWAGVYSGTASLDQAISCYGANHLVAAVHKAGLYSPTFTVEHYGVTAGPTFAFQKIGSSVSGLFGVTNVDIAELDSSLAITAAERTVNGSSTITLTAWNLSTANPSATSTLQLGDGAKPIIRRVSSQMAVVVYTNGTTIHVKTVGVARAGLIIRGTSSFTVAPMPRIRAAITPLFGLGGSTGATVLLGLDRSNHPMFSSFDIDAVGGVTRNTDSYWPPQYYSSSTALDIAPGWIPNTFVATYLVEGVLKTEFLEVNKFGIESRGSVDGVAGIDATAAVGIGPDAAVTFVNTAGSTAHVDVWELNPRGEGQARDALLASTSNGGKPSSLGACRLPSSAATADVVYAYHDGLSGLMKLSGLRIGLKP